MKILRRYWTAIVLAFGALTARLAGVHFCSDELYALLACLSFADPVRAWLDRCVQTWRGRHAKPVCRHHDGRRHHSEGE